MFDYVEERVESPALSLSYHVAPWDREAFSTNTAVIASIRLGTEADAYRPFKTFADWCGRNDVKLVCCRLEQDRLKECGFLEKLGFRFIELNYRPTIDRLERFPADPEIDVVSADPSDAAEIAMHATQTFSTGRLHADPQIDSEIGARRYAAWVPNAFANPTQRVLKCMMNGRLIAYFVVERPAARSGFWSFNGLATNLAGRGLGRRAWSAMLAFHAREGIEDVSTSISSLNVSAFNLYVSLGFRFPPPTITLHWCPFGPLVRAAT